MTISGINIQAAISQAESQLKKDKDSSPALKASLNLLILIIALLLEKMGLNSKNSDISPSQDKFLQRDKKEEGNKKKGRPAGVKGSTLELMPNP